MLLFFFKVILHLHSDYCLKHIEFASTSTIMQNINMSCNEMTDIERSGPRLTGYIVFIPNSHCFENLILVPPSKSY